MNDSVKLYQEVSVLLVEDDEIDADCVIRAFKKIGLENLVHRAKDGIEALEMLRTPGKMHRPLVLLVDLNMPRMNGIELINELRNDPNLSTLVVFVLTTSRADEDRLSAYKHHVAGYIVKNEMDTGFIDLVTMLDEYWRIVVLPN